MLEDGVILYSEGSAIRVIGDGAFPGAYRTWATIVLSTGLINADAASPAKINRLAESCAIPIIAERRFARAGSRFHRARRQV